jgi:hypothetical protein
MSDFDVDRQSFIRSKETEPQPQPRSPIIGPVFLLAVLAIVGVVGYKILSSSEALNNSKSDAAIVQIGQRLDAMEKRLDQVEKRRRTTSAGSSTTTEESETVRSSSRPIPNTASAAAGALAAPPGYRISPQPKTQSDPSPQPTSAADLSSKTEKEVASSQPDPSPGKEEWEATADRLGNVVGELNTQRDEIERNREGLSRLSEGLGGKNNQTFTRQNQTFTLQKGSKWQRVGPVSLGLESTDPGNQRYTLRLFVDDKAVELKDRALHEAIQFYALGGKVAVELVISEIRKDRVTGRLAYPPSTSSR